MSSGYPPPPPPPAGTPLPYGYPPQYAAPRTRRTWVIVLSIVAGIVLLVVLFVAGLVFAIFTAIKSGEPYQHAVHAATHDPGAVSALGSPVTAGWYLSGNMNVSGSSGNADLAIPVSGSRQKGMVYVVAKKSAGRWTYSTLELKVDGQESRVNLLPQSSPEPSEK